MTTCGFGEVPEEYKSKIILSPTRLMEFMNSPRHYKHKYIDGNKTQTDAMEEGKMVHMYFLEPEKFQQKYQNPFPMQDPIKTVEDMKEYLTLINISFKGSQKKEYYEDLIYSNNSEAPLYDMTLKRMKEENINLLSSQDQDMLRELGNLKNEHKWLNQAMRGGHCEQKMWYYDKDLDMVFRMITDYFHMALGNSKVPLVLDLKKIPNLSPVKFNKWLYESKAYVQLAMYRECLLNITGLESQCVIAGYDTKPPFLLEAFHVDIGAIEAGRHQFKKKALDFKYCVENNHWPSYGDGHLLSGTLPHWAFGQIEYEEAVEA